MEDKILKYEDMRQGSYMAYVQAQFAKNSLELPTLNVDGVTQTSGQIIPHVSHGRWCVDCPICHSAKLVSRELPYFICGEIGCKGSKTWYEVLKPVDAEAIEAALLKRPAVRPDLAVNRNWLSYQGETLADLEAENVAAGG